MTEYRGQVEAAVRAVHFPSPERYSWFGHWRSTPRGLADTRRRAMLLSQLQADLYFNFYVLGEPAPPHPEPEHFAAPDAGLVSALAKANRGKGYWEPGWTIESVSGDTVEVSRLELHVWPRRAPAGPSATA